MMRGLQKRLRKLECSLPCRKPEPTEHQKVLKYAQHLVWFSVANYLGDPTPGEAPTAAYARALGYAHEGELENAMANDPSYGDKRALANRKLFAKFGVNLDAPDWKKIVKAFKRMEADLPEFYKTRLIDIFHDRSRD